VDRQGPQLRVGTFTTDRVILTTGAKFALDHGGPGEKERVSLPHPEIFQALSPGVQLLLDDGKAMNRPKERVCFKSAAPLRAVVTGTRLHSHFVP
jgi:pyruvate kinase